MDSGQQSDKIEGPALNELRSPVDGRQRSSYAVDSTTGLKHTSVITNHAVRIVALLNVRYPKRLLVYPTRTLVIGLPRLRDTTWKQKLS